MWRRSLPFSSAYAAGRILLDREAHLLRFRIGCMRDSLKPKRMYEVSHEVIPGYNFFTKLSCNPPSHPLWRLAKCLVRAFGYTRLLGNLRAPFPLLPFRRGVWPGLCSVTGDLIKAFYI